MTSTDQPGQRDEGFEPDDPAGPDAVLGADSAAIAGTAAAATDAADDGVDPWGSTVDGTADEAGSASYPEAAVPADPFAGLESELANRLRETLAGGVDLSVVQALMAAATVATSGIGEVSFQAPRKDLAGLVGDLGHLAALCTAGQIMLTAEADRDGVVDASTCRSTTGWVRDADWHLTVGAASQIAKCARILRRGELGSLGEAIRSADVGTSVAVAIESEFDKIVADLETDIDELPEAVRDHILTDFDGDLHQTVLDKMVEVGADHGPRAVTEFRESFLAQYGTAGAFDEEQASKKNYIELSGGLKRAGVFEYKLTLDAEGHSVLEAAINTLCAPQPDSTSNGTGDLDSRSVGRRRGEGLVELCRRAVAAGSLPASPKTVVYLNANLDNLQNLSGAAVVVGTPAAGTILSAETARRMMCEACTVIPVVTDGDGTVIGVAEEIRLYNRKLTRALWRRDMHCTFPGCDAPATWCDVHHLIHYVDGGPTTPNNAALLCGRHHTVVHRDLLAGRLVGARVVWDLEPGSYTRMLAAAGGPTPRESRKNDRNHRQHRRRPGSSRT